MAVLITQWTIRNYVHFDEFIPASSSSVRNSSLGSAIVRCFLRMAVSFASSISCEKNELIQRGINSSSAKPDLYSEFIQGGLTALISSASNMPMYFLRVSE